MNKVMADKRFSQRLQIWIVLATTLFILSVINYSILQKEQHLSNGQVVYLKLAPLDPRSIMQGDYMTLAFEVGQQIQSQMAAVPPDQIATQTPPSSILSSEGFVIVELDENNIGRFIRLATADKSPDSSSGTSPNSRQLKLQYRVRDNKVKFATNAFFFEEGSAQLYQDALYGELRVNQAGEVLLNGLLDKDLVSISGGISQAGYAR